MRAHRFVKTYTLLMRERAAIYCRLSWSPDGSVEKVDRQEEDCRTTAGRLGWTVSEQHVYKDNSASAWKRNRKRPGWDAMLAAIQAGEVDKIVVYHGDRLVRQPKDLEQLLSLADQKRVQLASVSGVRDLSSADDRFILRIEVAQACKASDDTSRRVKRGWAARATKGLPVGGGRRPFGFEADHVTRRESEAEVLADAASRMLAGQTIGGVVEWLNKVSTTSTGGRWTARALQHLMLAPRIAGLIEHDGRLHEAVWEPIISVEDWEEIKSLYATRAQAYPYPGRARKYLLAGIAECHQCQQGMSTKPVGGRNRKSARIYVCRRCMSLGRNAQHLDEYVTSHVLRVLNQPDFVAELTADTDPRLGQEIVTLERRRDQARQQLEDLADHPDIDPALIAKSLTSFSRRIEDLRSQQVASTKARVLARAAGIDRAGWDALPVDVRAQIVRALFRVVVLPTSQRGPGFDPSAVRVTRRPLDR